MVAPSHRAQATPLVTGAGTRTAQNPLFGDEAVCFSQDARGPNHVLFYRVTIPAFRTLSVQTSPTAIADPTAPTACMVAQRSSSAELFTNTSFFSSKTVLVAIGALNDMPILGRFNVTFSIQ